MLKGRPTGRPFCRVGRDSRALRPPGPERFEPERSRAAAVCHDSRAAAADPPAFAFAEQGLDALTEEIQAIVYDNGIQPDGCFVNSVRQVEILRQTELYLAAADETIKQELSADFIVIDLRSAWEKLGEITGDTVGEDIIDQIFSQFCIGK